MQDVSSGIPIVTMCILFIFIWAVINVHAIDHSKPVMLHFCTSFRIETFYSIFNDMREKQLPGLNRQHQLPYNSYYTAKIKYEFLKTIKEEAQRNL